VELQPDLNAAGVADVTARFHELGMKVIPTIANTTSGLWDTGTISAVIGNPALRKAHVNAVFALIQTRTWMAYKSTTTICRPPQLYEFRHRSRSAVHAIHQLLHATVHVQEDDVGYDDRNKSQESVRLPTWFV
jgi:hypothetical protein